MQVWTVATQAGYHDASHVDGLRRQLARVAPEAELICLTDRTDVACCSVVQMRYSRPGSWAKVEVALQELESDDDLLYIDLDNAVVGDLADMFATTGTVTLRDFFNADQVSCGVLKISIDDRLEISETWIRSAEGWIDNFRARGWQGFIERMVGDRSRRWQDVLPGQVVSYKADMWQEGLKEPPAGARVVSFEKMPRPFKVEANWLRASMRTGD